MIWKSGFCFILIVATVLLRCPEVTAQNDETTESSDSPIEIQTQIYIVSGTLGGLILLLIILVLALALSIGRLKDQISNRHQRYIPAEDPTSGYGIRTGRPGEQIHAYDNTAFSGSHEMEERKPDSKSDVERLGYEMYNGKSDKRYTGAQIPRAGDRMTRDSHQLRLEDSVVPMGPGGGSADRRDYRRGNQAAGNDRDRYRY